MSGRVPCTTFWTSGCAGGPTTAPTVTTAAIDGGVNLSWGADNASTFVQSSIVDAQNNGMIVVAAAGNEAEFRRAARGIS